MTVDGLVLCNEKVARSTMEENGNASSVGDVSANVSQGIAHERANFPFVEGNAFTATLWVGLEDSKWKAWNIFCVQGGKVWCYKQLKKLEW